VNVLVQEEECYYLIVKKKKVSRTLSIMSMGMAIRAFLLILASSLIRQSCGKVPVVSGSGEDPVVSGSGEDPVVSGSGEDPVVSGSGEDPVVSGSTLGPPPPDPLQSLLQPLGVVLQINSAVLKSVRIPLTILNSTDAFDLSPLIRIITALAEIVRLSGTVVNLLQTM